MGVRLRFQSSGTMPSDAAPLILRGPSLTIGRGATNDVVLPDPDQMLSRNHCVIEDHGSHVAVVDLSSNGTFLNYGKMPLGPTPTPLNNGDVLTVGSYELAVEITQDDALPDPLMVDPLAVDPLSPGRAENAPDPLALLDDAGPGGDFLDDLLGEATPTGPSQINPVDPIDDLLPPLGEEEDPFFQKPNDGREGQGASLPAHNPAAQDGFTPQHAPQANVIPDDWDDEFFSGIGGSPEPAEPAPPPRPQPEPLPEPAPPVVAPVAPREEPSPVAPVAIPDNPFAEPIAGTEDRTPAPEPVAPTVAPVATTPPAAPVN
ncbi:FHA domain-containing protein, partial [Phaeobacter sp. HF9A]|uniref:FHA domain-containing protein n=1 Tax=Phaeobacter sp. HF9A TaxID=2721561 RepID=UPI00142F9ED5